LSDEPYNREIKKQLSQVRERLGGGGADQRMADLVVSMAGQP